MEIEKIKIHDYKDLILWQKGMDLAERVYLLSAEFPKSEIYGLVSQIRRAAVSIPSNIAEGHARYSDNEFIRFLSIANGSLKEVETQLYLAIRLRYVDETQAQPTLTLCSDVARLLNALRKTVLARIEQSGKREAGSGNRK